MDKTNAGDISKHVPSAPPCTQCGGSGRVVLLTIAGPCTACGGTGKTGGAADWNMIPVEPTERKHDERGRIVGENWVAARGRIECRYDPETGRLMEMLHTSLEPAAALLTQYTYY